MKTSGARAVLFASAICLGLRPPAPPAWAVQLGQEAPGGAAEIERVCAVISSESGPASREAAPLPVIKRDRQGRIWAAWANWEDGRSQIELASFNDSGIDSARTVGPSVGDQVSPDFALSPNGTPWIIWVDARGGETCVRVLDTSSNAAWTLAAGSSTTSAGPKILFDAEGSPWAFWSVTSGGSGEVVYRVFDGGNWTAPALVPRGTNWPAVNPDSVVDGRGTIWLAWSGYDGEDYGIYLTHRTETGWAPPTLVSGNPGPNLFPALGLDSDGSLLVAWNRSSDRGRLVCLRRYDNGTAGPEISLGSQPDQPAPPRLIQSAGGPVVAMRSGDRVRVTFLPEVKWTGLPEAPAAPAPPRLPNTLLLDENRYAGVGDSITFGYIDFYPFPERGYIPRLNAILNTEYGSQRVINEGFGGEVTADGVVRISKVFIADLARYILIMEGTNDVIFGEITIESAAFNLREMVRKSLAAGAFPAIATILPRFDFFGTLKVFQDRILLLNSRIRQIAADMAVPLVDMNRAFNSYPRPNGGVLSLLSADLKHPSDKGYQFMAETWFSAIRSFPFPPADLRVATVRPEKAVRGRILPRQVGPPRTSRAVPADPRQPYGNRLTWSPSPKILDTSGILGYRLYRKASTGAAAAFELLAFVEQPLEYFDIGVKAVGGYAYALATVRKDGIEGPVSDTVR